VTAYIGLGANLGDRHENLREAVRRLRKLGRVTAVSSLYETAPVGYVDQPPFLNAVVGLETRHGPQELMAALLAIERDLGRTRSFQDAPRTLDLDLLLYGEATFATQDLTVPHPRLHERLFVLEPLAEIAPDAWHPCLNESALALLAALPDRSRVDRLAGPGWDGLVDGQ
jgi:2-amino-4-hydroxy-6-hydroxymethyldihydropteridine diphosphokinase